MTMNGSKWVLGTLLSLALIAGSAQAESSTNDLPCSGDYTVNAVVTPGIGHEAAVIGDDPTGMGNGGVVFSVKFDPNTNGITVNGEQVGMYEPTTSYEVIIDAETVNGELVIDVTVRIAGCGSTVTVQNDVVCDGAADEVTASAETVSELSVG